MKFVLVAIALIILVSAKTKTENKIKTEIELNYVFDKIPSIDTIFAYADKHLKNRAFLFLTIKIEESGSGSQPSYLALNYNNLCGMRMPNKRKTYAIGETNTGYSIYRNWFESMLDFKIYLNTMEQHYINLYKKTPSNVDLIEYMNTNFNHLGSWKINTMKIYSSVEKKYKSYVKNYKHEK